MNTNSPLDPAEMWKAAYNFPLSGPVQIMQNLGFYNINNSTTGEQGDIIEKRITQEIGSYGRQIGWIIEVLDIIMNKIEKDHDFIKQLKPEEDESIRNFSYLVDRVKKVKESEQKKLGPSKNLMPKPVDLGILLSGIHDLRSADRNAYDEMIKRIEDFLDEERTKKP